ncbi:DUF1214 domain-containing protein [Roseibium sp. Sym1]|uniref:DUF1214 domain-containing protein n=1 Tax=Roseibium sp. Sym1 TaxID=3016006 RepID=UPI0022B304CA|nr:DUF1214 domain-containing protein [Roseibium sp. Sym1]
MRFLLALALCAPTLAFAEDVTLDNLVRAETDHMIRANMKAFGLEIGQLVHQRETVDVDNQPVIRMNVDTVYSSLMLDLSEPVGVALPEIGGRYQSMQVINQDHYMFVEAAPGTYRLTENRVGTRFAAVVFRTFIDPTDPEDVAAAHAAQDGISVSGGGAGPFDAPDWDLSKLATARKAMNDLAADIGFNARHAFGLEDEVRPVDYMVGAMVGWGGLPANAAMYVVDSVEQNDGETPFAVTAKDVPVDAFWSITVYNADGYMEPNELGRNNFNNVTAEPNDDGSRTIHFGACDDGRINCIPITPGWNYAIRLYEPTEEILNGSWTFPSFEKVN